MVARQQELEKTLEVMKQLELTVKESRDADRVKIELLKQSELKQ
jgi:hypothetical protein